MAIKPPNFNKPNKAPPPPIVAKSIAPPPQTSLQLNANGPPLPKRQVYVPEGTKTQLYKIGWKDGDPIPGDFALRLQEIYAEQERERASATHDLPPDWVPPKLTTVNLDDLSPERRAELQQTLAEYKQTVATQAAQKAAAAREAEENVNIPDDIQHAREVAAQAAAQTAVQGKNFAFVDDRPPIPVPEGKKLGGVSGLSPAFGKIEQINQERMAQPQQPAQPPQHTHESPETAGVAIPHTHCPRCKWDLARPFDVTITEQDKTTFRAAILHPKNIGRFRKEYDVVPGLKVRFRGMTMQEKKWLRKQMRRDILAGNISNEAEFYAEMMAYRMACSIEQIDFDGDASDIPEVASVQRNEADPDGNPLVDMREWFETEVATTESLMSLLAEKHAEFQRLVEALEAKAGDPNFWRGIEPVR